MTHGITFEDIFSDFPFGELFVLGLIILGLGLYLFYAYVQYILSKKLEIAHSWMAWVPVLSIFNFVKIAGKSYWWVLWIILGFTAFVIPGIILVVTLLHNISKRTGHGGWWTVGLIFGRWLFLPVTAFYYQKGDEINPRPLTGWKKGLLIFLGILSPVIFLLNLLGASILTFMNNR